MTQWTITEDHVADPDAKPGTNANAVGVVGPRGAVLSSKEIVDHPDSIPFRMRDDDHELVYVGFLLGDDLFAPLDDFGMPNAGCTEIEVREHGEWKPV